MFNIVVMKFIAPKRLLTPDKCNANIARSTLGPLWLCTPDKGGYKVQPVPAPFSIPLANKNNTILGIKSQKLMLFNLGNAMSGPPTNKGNKKFPKPPIIAGITMKNIITIAWAVMILLYNWLSEMYCTPGALSSILIRTEKAVPIKPANKANIKYNVPMSFALEDQNHLSKNMETSLFFKFRLDWSAISKLK